LREGGSAIDAVVAAIRILEAGAVFNAGVGSSLRAGDRVRMDAAVMDGDALNIGAVGSIENVKHPIDVAHALLTEPPVLLVGSEATAYARERSLGRPSADLLLDVGRKRGADKDTVGCVARDRAGNLACGTSTGGLSDSRPGRVGDSPLPGCGFYADNTVGGVALSGDGENIMRMMLAGRIYAELGSQDPDEAIGRGLAALKRVGGEVGAIAIDRHGRIGWGHNSVHYPIAYTGTGLAACYVLAKDEADRKEAM
jgi:beta-aspartyl-peptidase (threonine type)